MARLVLLGSPEVEAESRVAISGQRRQTLLSVLAVRRNRVVGATELLELVWVGRPEHQALRSLRSEIHRLRGFLRGCASLETRPGGYRLSIPPDALDIEEFETLADPSHPAFAGSPAPALARFDRALRLWGGRPFGELADCPLLDLERDRLESLRLDIIERRAATLLRAGGDLGGLAAELAELTVQWPFRERLWAQLMKALWSTGRQAAALDAYQRARAVLVDQLGIEPGPELKNLELAILHHDLGSLPTEPVRVPSTAPTSVVPKPSSALLPLGLPTMVTSFVGRVSEIASLCGAVGRAAHQPRRAGRHRQDSPRD